eukprot:NODE_4552_length_1048_cov_7.255135_g4349_i0.p1 GENE.NODE_4552_length_1048_cov_7.255135_g4349_i0~~NODE_4552_length_1048_cov_7.255135_g4349_i0.p1  ORF type:complete len:286 (-),score=25.19 NODE_4552_length_1048_cov_7.255135_g4349_i0:153-1010(-)
MADPPGPSVDTRIWSPPTASYPCASFQPRSPVYDNDPLLWVENAKAFEREESSSTVKGTPLLTGHSWHASDSVCTELLQLLVHSEALARLDVHAVQHMARAVLRQFFEEPPFVAASRTANMQQDQVNGSQTLSPNKSSATTSPSKSSISSPTKSLPGVSSRKGVISLIPSADYVQPSTPPADEKEEEVVWPVLPFPLPKGTLVPLANAPPNAITQSAAAAPFHSPPAVSMGPRPPAGAPSSTVSGITPQSPRRLDPIPNASPAQDSAQGPSLPPRSAYQSAIYTY